MPALFNCFCSSFRSLTCGLLATSTIALTACGVSEPSDRASENAAEVNPALVYARVLWDIERERAAAYQALTAEIASDKLPPLSCDQPKSLRVLRDKARDIAVEFCNTARERVEQSPLTPQEFNQITQESETDAQLKGAIEAELLRIRTDEATLTNQ